MGGPLRGQEGYWVRHQGARKVSGWGIKGPGRLVGGASNGQDE